MHFVSRRVLLSGVAALGLAGCQSTQPKPEPAPARGRGRTPPKPAEPPKPLDAKPPAPKPDPDRYKALYGAIGGEKFPVNAIPPGVIGQPYWREDVTYFSSEPAGTIVIDPKAHYLYFVLGGNKAIRYGVGVGREGFAWSGTAEIKSKQEWPDWYPPKEMIERQPDLKKQVTKLQSGDGVAGGPRNPLGARAMYLWQNNKDTLFRIHGTIDPGSIGKSVSSGCIRMANQDVIDLYARVPLGAKVVVTGNAQPALPVVSQLFRRS